MVIVNILFNMSVRAEWKKQRQCLWVKSIFTFVGVTWDKIKRYKNLLKGQIVKSVSPLSYHVEGRWIWDLGLDKY